MLSNLKAFLLLRYGLLFRKKSIEKSLNILENAISKYNNYPYLFLHAGLLYQEKKDFANAVACLKKAQDLSCKNPTLDLFMGKILWDQAKYPEAIAVLQKSLEKDQHNQLAWGYLALSFLAMKNYSEFHKILREKGISENHELQIRIILTLEKNTRKWNLNEL